ncbi:MAG TPA: ABC transporter ATP-binding protein [Candidatus Eisenbacteria bacterium]
MRALDDVSLSVRAGEAFGIIGPNGAGKTTLLGCLLGLLTPDAGRIRVDGHAADDLAVRSATGYLPERLVLDRWMTGLDFLEYHHALARLDPARRREEAAAALERVGLAPGDGRMAIRRYSRGMLQRLGLAQAMLGEPRYLFLDEPISGIDPAGVILFRRLLGELRARGATLVINSHQLDEVERICDRVAFVRGGKVQSIETMEAGAAAARVLLVRWAGGTQAEAVAPGRLAALGAGAQATLIESKPPEARFSVADDEGAALLLQTLLAAGVRVIEATPEGGRLERLFVEQGGAAGGGAGAGPGAGPDPGASAGAASPRGAAPAGGPA